MIIMLYNLIFDNRMWFRGVWECVAFQSVFYSEIHQNNIFYFKKIIFDISTSKGSENIKKNINLK
jgi:hypothetical protein